MAAVFARAQGVVAAHQAARHFGRSGPDTRFDGHGACYVELGGGIAAKGEGDFLATPAPRVVLHEPSAEHHVAKELEEAEWLALWGAAAPGPPPSSEPALPTETGTHRNPRPSLRSAE